MQESSQKLRPTKKQKELLQFIDNFINQHGYSPSFREIMRGLNYKSVSTVATHIDSLVSRGHLVKRDNSARSLELTRFVDDNGTIKITEQQSKWLMKVIDQKFSDLPDKPTQKHVDELYVLVGALKILGLPEAAESFKSKLQTL